MRKLLIPLAVAAVGLTGCASSAPPKMERAIQESQVRAFTDQVLAELRKDPDPTVRVLAENPDRTGGMYPTDGYRAAIEKDGRNLCSHMIAGVPVDQAYSAAYPQGEPTARTATTSRIAADVLCPLRPVDD